MPEAAHLHRQQVLQALPPHSHVSHPESVSHRFSQVRCWEIQANGTSMPKAAHSHEQPVLCSAWNADGATVYSGGCDNTVKAWNLATNQQQVGMLSCQSRSLCH